MAEREEQDPVSYEDLAVIEDEFDDIDTEIIRKQYTLSKPVYAKRSTAIARIPNFWALVLEQAPLEIDPFIQPTDSGIFAEHLTNFTVNRFELDDDSEGGNPRSLCFRFEFSENAYFTNSVLEKKFWYRRAKDGWTGLVSEPVKIEWKKGKDLTEGLTDGAGALWEARVKKGDMLAKEMKEYSALAKKVEQWNGANTSFFTWFGYVSRKRWISAEESKEAMAKRKADREAGKKTSDGEQGEQGEDEGSDDQEVEVHEAGEDIAFGLAEDVWPNAIKFFTQAMENDMMSDEDFEEDDEDDDEEASEEGDDAPVDIRSLVQDKGPKARTKGDGGPPSKKPKKK